VYEHLEYTPYGELWVEHAEQDKASVDKTVFRFTGKERDGETGLYYYGARYLNPQTGLWLSTDPAVGEYVPQAPINDEAKKANGNLPGMGGVFNTVNLHLYHYAGNNPVRYVDPDGKIINSLRYWDHQDNSRNGNLDMGSYRTYDSSEGPANTIGRYGCLFTSVVNIGNTERLNRTVLGVPVSDRTLPLSDLASNDKYYPATKNGKEGGYDRNMTASTIKELLDDMTGGNFYVSNKIEGNARAMRLIRHYERSLTRAYIIADVGGHFVNVLGLNKDTGGIIVHDPLVNGKKEYEASRVKGIFVIQRL
jgi:RHS repeat-associated protein